MRQGITPVQGTTGEKAIRFVEQSIYSHEMLGHFLGREVQYAGKIGIQTRDSFDSVADN